MTSLYELFLLEKETIKEILGEQKKDTWIVFTENWFTSPRKTYVSWYTADNDRLQANQRAILIQPFANHPPGSIAY